MNFEEIKELVALFDDSNLSKMEISEENFSINLEKNYGQAPVMAAAPAPLHVHPIQGEHVQLSAATEAGDVKRTEGDEILSPMVGTFYRSPAPNASVFVNVGDTVKKGQVLCILEAMKIMNELEADFDCKILEILPDDGQPVEYGAPLFIVEKI